MNTLDIIEAVNALDEELLADALTDEAAPEEPAAGMPQEEENKQKGLRTHRFSKRNALLRWAAMAACLLIMILAGAALGGSGRVTAVEDPQAETHLLEDFWIRSERQSNASRIYHVIVQNFFSYDQHGMPLYPDDCGQYGRCGASLQSGGKSVPVRL